MPGSAPRADGLHVRVAIFIVNNKPETMERIRPHVKVGSSHDAAVRRAVLVSRAQRSTKRSGMMRCRPGTVTVRGGPGSAMHRFADARAASHPGHPSLGRVRSLIHFSNSPARSRHAFLRPGFATLLRSPESTGG